MRRPCIVDDTSAPSATSPAEVGGKGFNLLRLRSLGLKVPRFVIVTRQAFDDAVGGSRTISDRLAAASDAAPGELAAASAHLAAVVRAHGCPGRVARELEAALETLGLGKARLAVRSSVLDEDSSEHSFAGLMDTRLGVSRGDVAAAVVDVWASAFSARALAYRQRTGLIRRPIATAVIVQEMVHPAAAGVLFTRDPDPAHGCAAGARRCVISAAYGLGEGVVAGTAEVDHYRIAWDGSAVERHLGSKLSRRVAAPQGGTTAEAVPPRLRDAPALGDAQVRQLRDLGTRLERGLGSPQDVEWAFDGAGRLLVLQARPIVAAPARSSSPAESHRRVWDDANIVESYPGLTLPLTFSFVRDAYETAFRGAAKAFFPIVNPVAARPELCATLVGLLRGRVYYNLLSWYELFSHLSHPDRHRERWDRLVGVLPGQEPRRTAPRPFAGRVLALLGAVRVLLGARRMARRFDRRFEAFLSKHRDAAGEPDPARLAVRYRRLEQEAAGFWHLTLFADLSAMRYYDWAAALVARWAPDVPHLANRLLRGQPGVESVAPVRRLAALAERARREPGWLGVLRQADATAAWRDVCERPELAPLHEALRGYLEDFGDRSVEELKLETPTFRERPERLIALLRRYAEGDLCERTLLEGPAEARRAAEREADRQIRGWRRPVCRWVVARAREAIRNRENMRFARSRLFGIVRRLFRSLGEQLAAAGALERAEDVFYLSTAEALGFVEATSVTVDLRALVSLRRREYAGYATSDLPDRLETRGLPHLATPTRPAAGGDAGHGLVGIGCSAGVATGAARVVLSPDTASLDRGDVLVARSTDPGWVFLMMSAAGLVAERGSPLSHTAIIGRELGIPTVVGVAGATTRIPPGCQLRLDGGTGRVEWS